MENETLVALIQESDYTRPDLMQALYQQNIGFIRMQAMKYCKAEELEDLLQESYLALDAAVHNYDNTAGALFISYFSYWQRSYLARLALDRQLQPVPRKRRAIAIRIKAIEDELTRRFGHAPSVHDIETHSAYTEQEIRQALNDLQVMNKPSSLDAPIKSAEGDLTVGDMVGDTRNDYADIEEKIDAERLSGALWDVVNDLPRESAEIITERYRNALTGAETAERLNIPYSTVRSRETAALARLKRSKALLLVLTESGAYTYGMRNTGLTSFRRSGMSAPEAAVIKAEEMKERYARMNHVY